MFSSKETFIKLCYTLILSAIMLKVSILCVSFSADKNFNKFQDYSIWGNESHKYVDLLPQSIIVGIYEVFENSHKYPNTIQFANQINNQQYNILQRRPYQQFFPEPSICSHTGIYLCLRL
ncbi:MAG: hypothetical protein CVT95_11400 [Bacteroidetes bacterium HGW-Bacteroidetes-12]|nr:MAG: hypothetical protein CVT95_11400 [Bacteroidetes bacterium HGW-Bacteroidetes-12]